jgi:hypothetical protein
VEVTDGVWWPLTTDLQVELPQLDVAVHHLTGARIARVGYERHLWGQAPRKVRTPLGITHIGWFEHSRYPDHITLSLSNYQRLVLSVLPPDTDVAVARELLESAGA